VQYDEGRGQILLGEDDLSCETTRRSLRPPNALALLALGIEPGPAAPRDRVLMSARILRWSAGVDLVSHHRVRGASEAVTWDASS
jgi:hypothetical protein